jgi:hypothetical protein
MPVLALLTILRGDTASLSLTGLGSLAGRSKLWFTAKGRPGDTDADSILQIEETAGLISLNGAAGSPSAGSITVTNATTGALTIALTAAATAVLEAPMYLVYDLQLRVGAVITTLGIGPLHVTSDVTRVTS